MQASKDLSVKAHGTHLILPEISCDNTSKYFPMVLIKDLVSKVFIWANHIDNYWPDSKKESINYFWHQQFRDNESLLSEWLKILKYKFHV